MKKAAKTRESIIHIKWYMDGEENVEAQFESVALVRLIEITKDGGHILELAKYDY